MNADAPWLIVKYGLSSEWNWKKFVEQSYYEERLEVARSPLHGCLGLGNHDGASFIDLGWKSRAKERSTSGRARTASRASG